MTRVKICGLTHPADVEAVNAARPDYAGFIFAPSQRRVSLEQAARLTEQLEPAIQPVGVFVNASVETIWQAVESAGLAIVQLHGREDSSFRFWLRKRLPENVQVWQKISIPADPEAAVRRVAQWDKAIREQVRVFPDAWLLDTEVRGQAGGTGLVMPWDLLQVFCQAHPVILAGGLRPDNVASAVQLLQPYGVDCSSGVETDNRKDPQLIAAFCVEARRNARPNPQTALDG